MAAAPKPEGIVFPANDKGERSTSDAGKNIFAASFAAMGCEKLAEECRKEKNWRYRYNKYVLNHVQESLKTPEAALKGSIAGLEYMHNNFEFIRDGKSYKVAEAMKEFKGTFHTGFIKGSKPRGNAELVVPYKGKELRGDALLAQLKKWADYGTIEQSAADAIGAVVKNKSWADLSDQYFVLLGAGSAMGPFLVLMALGANIIALDLDRPQIWKRLISIAEQSSGTITFPLKKPQKDITSSDDLYANAGANLITHAPEINNWLTSKEVFPDKQLTIGCYVYLDGEAHVKVVLACDAIIKGLTESRKAGVAFLCTPTDVHVIPDEARRAALTNYHSFDWRNLLLLPIRAFTGQKILAKNALPQIKGSNGDFSIVDGLTVPQGPNYALAKRMQHWRAIVARNSGCIASSHIAPSTATASVVHNKQFAWAYDGMPYFRPYEIFEQETSNAVMSAILIHDLNNPKAVANPANPLPNPLAMFKENAFHGGVWRSAYKINTIGEVSVLIHFVKVLRPVLALIFVAFIAFLYQRFST